MRAAIYLRVSTEEQGEKYGLDVQQMMTRAMATVKQWQVVEPPFMDDGISGTLDETGRPALAELLAAAEDKRIDAVIVSALDRLGRKTSLVLSLVERLAKLGVIIVSCKESLDTSTPSGQFVLTVFAALAQLERDTIVERTTNGRNERGKVDGEKGGRLPLGYRRIFGTEGSEKGKAIGVEIDHKAADIVRDIFEWRNDGDTLQKIAHTLNFNGVTTARGKRWHASSVREVILNEDAYKGGLRGDSKLQWPKLL
jgi:site-specific DNA recombinase